VWRVADVCHSVRWLADSLADSESVDFSGIHGSTRFLPLVASDRAHRCTARRWRCPREPSREIWLRRPAAAVGSCSDVDQPFTNPRPGVPNRTIANRDLGELLAPTLAP
jgi:hypothetical protein